MSEQPTIDYTDKDYSALRRAMLDLARYRLPEWTDHTPADLGTLLTDMVAYTGDLILYYLDRVASELFPDTAVERESVVQLLRLIGYELRPAVPAAATLNLILDVPPAPAPAGATIPGGAQFRSRLPAAAPQTFEYLGPTLAIDLRSDQVRPAGSAGQVIYDLPVWHGATQPPTVIGSSRGEPNQGYRVPFAPVLDQGLVVEVDEGAGWVRWSRRDSFLYDVDENGRARVSAADGRDYIARHEADGSLSIQFGDDTFGSIPPRGANNIRVSARIGGGSIGNLPAGAIDTAVTPIAGLAAVTNPAPAAGGEDAESSAAAVRTGPGVYRSGWRAVTAEDYAALALAAGGVAKVRARVRAWNLIELVVAPAGEVCAPVPEALRLHLVQFFEDKRMAGTLVRVRDPACVPIDLALGVQYDPRFQSEQVRQGVADGLSAHFAYTAVDFGQVFYLSDLYGLVEAIPGVVAVAIRRFQRHDRPGGGVDAALRDAGLPPVADLPEDLRLLLAERAAVETRIALGAEEIATLGTLELTMQVGAP
jgi:hypothetical protein